MFRFARGAKAATGSGSAPSSTPPQLDLLCGRKGKLKWSGRGRAASLPLWRSAPRRGSLRHVPIIKRLGEFASLSGNICERKDRPAPRARYQWGYPRNSGEGRFGQKNRVPTQWSLPSVTALVVDEGGPWRLNLISGRSNRIWSRQASDRRRAPANQIYPTRGSPSPRERPCPICPTEASDHSS